MIRSLSPLAAAGTGQGALSGLFLPLVLLLAAVAVGAVVIYWVRRSTGRQTDEPEEGFTLHDLRILRDTARITEDEFQRAKAAIIERVTAPSDSAGGEKDAEPPDEQPA